jgi:threonine dehydratase
MMNNQTNSETSFGIQEVWAARERITPYILRTPLIFSDALSSLTNAEVYLKMECWQKCGCFKVRGALNKIASLSVDQRQNGLVSASSGNHAIGVAYASSVFGHPPTTIFMPESTDATRKHKVDIWGASVVLRGQFYQNAYESALRFTTEHGATYIHSHADRWVMAGQGTIGLEIIEDLPDVDAVIVPIGGGGMVSGIGTAVKSANRKIRIIGVEPAAAPSAYRSINEGVCCETITPLPSLADGLLSGVSRMTFDIFKHFVEQVVLISEDEIIEALRLFQVHEQLMIEAASSVGLAALLHHPLELAGKKVVLIITSRNIDADRYNHIIKREH